jgi:hypothetical protein
MEQLTTLGVLDDMEEIHLCDTVELRDLLQERLLKCPAGPLGAQAVLAEFESFIKRLTLGDFRLRPEAELDATHRDLMRTAFAAVCCCEELQVQFALNSLKTMLRAKPEEQSRIFSIARRGSVSVLLRASAAHVEVMKDANTRYVPYRLIHGLLDAADLLSVLRSSRYGTGFSKRFMDDIATFFTCVFAHACRGDAVMVPRLLPLAKIFRSNMPIGLLHPLAGQRSRHWLVFSA